MTPEELETVHRGRFTYENAKLEAAAAAVMLPPPPPASAPKAEHAAYAEQALGVPADQVQSMTKTDLVELARSAPDAQYARPATPPAEAADG